MTKKPLKLLLPVLLIGILMFTLTACGGGGSDTTDNNQPANDGGSSDDNSSAKEEKWISIATASTAGAWYPIGGGIAATINRHVPNIKANAETGAASLENVRNLVEGNVEVVFAQPDISMKAYQGLDMYEGKQQKNLRGLMSSYPTTAQFITVEGTGIEGLEDAVGKSIGVGAPGSGTEVFSKTVLEEYGITYDDVEEQFLGVPDHVTGLKDGNVDLSMSLMPVPTGAFTELAVTHNVKLLELTPEAQQTLADKLPGFFPFTIPANAYKGQTEPIPTLAYRGLIMTTDEMSEEDAYQIVKATYDYRDEWKDVHVVVKNMTLETAMEGMTIPLHPGAIKYYKEKGMDIPDELVPPEMK